MKTIKEKQIGMKKRNRRIYRIYRIIAALLAALTAAATFASCIKDDPELPEKTVKTAATETTEKTTEEQTEGTPTAEPTPRIRSIKLTSAGVTLHVGNTKRLSYTVSPAGIDQSGLVWASDDPEIATVENGVITAVKVGKTKVRLSRDDGLVSASCDVDVIPDDGEVMVVPIESIRLEKDVIRLGRGEVRKVNYMTEPYNAQEKEPSYKSSRTSVAYIDENGMLKGADEGISLLTVTCGKASAQCLVIVLKANGSLPDQAKESLVIGPGKEKEITFKNELIKNMEGLTYVSGSENIAKVKNGRIVGVNLGRTTISAKSPGGEVVYEFDVTVSNEYPIEGIKLNKTRVEIKVGETVQLTATLLPDGARQRRIEWICENKEIYSVTQDGLVKGLSVGEARVTAYVKDENGKSFTKTCLIVVTD